MTNGNKIFDWRAVAGFVALLIGFFTLTGYLTDDKIDSRIQKHSIETEATHQRNVVEIREDIASLKKGQENLERQNDRILSKLDELQSR